MIIVKLIGGLGNQLFQYAAGRRLAHMHGTELKMDVSHLGNPAYHTVRHYELSPFRIKQAFATSEDLDKFNKPDSLMSRAINRVMRRDTELSKSCIREKHYHFDAHILGLPDDIYLDGYWQSERYFADAADLIRADLTVAAPAEGRNRQLLEQIGTCNAVSVHVRRGDYVTDRHTAQYHGSCAMDYYHRAIRHVAEATANPVLFVFSDDPDWVRVNLRAPYPINIVDHNGPERCVEDLRLMSACRHHILANSSFSWWGAWLDPRPEKIVVAPEQWFRRADINTVDLLPAGWVRQACDLVNEGV